MGIDEKIFRGETLDGEEVQTVFYDYPCAHIEEDENRRWSRVVERIVEVFDENNEIHYFSVWGDIGLTECQDSYFEPQILKEKVCRKKVVEVEIWEDLESE